MSQETLKFDLYSALFYMKLQKYLENLLYVLVYIANTMGLPNYSYQYCHIYRVGSMTNNMTRVWIG
jgi:hypothetical protein